MGFIGIMGVIFIAVGLLISMPSSKNHAGNGSPAHEKFIILLSLLILLPLTAASKPLIPIMKTLFTDVTGTVPDAEEIAHKAELFRQQTGIAPFIVVLPDINNEASLRQNGKAMLAHASSSLSDVKGSVLLLFTTREPRLIMITNYQVESGLDDKHLGLLIENHTLAYLNADLWYQESIMHWLFYKHRY